MGLYSIFLEAEPPSHMAQDIGKGGKLGPFMQILAADEGLQGEGKEREDVMRFFLAKNVWHMSAQLPPKLGPAPLSSHSHTQLGPAPAGFIPDTGVISDAMSVQPGHPAQDVLRKEPIPTPTQAPPRPS